MANLGNLLAFGASTKAKCLPGWASRATFWLDSHERTNAPLDGIVELTPRYKRRLANRGRPAVALDARHKNAPVCRLGAGPGQRISGHAVRCCQQSNAKQAFVM